LRAAVARTFLTVTVILAAQVGIAALLARQASAGTSCAVVTGTPDGFLSLRSGPGPRFPEEMRLPSGTLIGIVEDGDVDGWAHVIFVRFEDGRISSTDGWVSMAYLEASLCP
jgi:uncharacterized protein YraI